MKCVLIFTILCVLINSGIYAANILYISLLPSRSHHIWDKTLALALKNRGHQITYVSHFAEESTENFTAIVFEGVYDQQGEETDYEGLHSLSHLSSITVMFQWMDFIADMDMKTNGFKQLNDLVDKSPKFDLIIMDTTAGQFVYPIFQKLNYPPVVGTSQFGIQPYHMYFFGNNLHYSYIPTYMLPFNDRMSYLERLQNHIYTNLFVFYRQFSYMPSIWEKTKKYYGENIPSYTEFEQHFSILLANYDPVLDYPQSLPPAIIPVGGLHTKREKSLPEDLQKILNDSKQGVILFSFGTNIKSKLISDNQKQALIQGLGRLKETILWKYEDDIKNLPKNIIVRQWLPQNDILAHPNVKAFITHGGALSTQEAMYHGVPMVLIPFFADQHSVTFKLINRNLGRSLTYGQLTADTVYNTVKEVANNKDLRKNLQEISKRFQDQKEDPLERAIWWVEYTLRQNGTQYLSVASKYISFWSILTLDVYISVVIVIFLILYMFKKFLGIMFSKKQELNLNKKTN